MPETAIREPAPWREPKEIKFPDSPPVEYVFERDCLTFPVLVDGKPAHCFVSAELLMQRFGAGDYAEDVLRYAFEQHRPAIQEMARHHLQMGWVDPFGNVMLTTRGTQLTVQYGPRLNGLPQYKAMAEEYQRLLESVIGPTGGKVNASWEQADKMFNQPFIGLCLSDESGEVVTYLNRMYFDDKARMRSTLTSLWGDLLLKRAQGIIQKSG